jgi:hypothetical protein
MKRFHWMIFLACLLPFDAAWAKRLSQQDAVALAEKYIEENGYTAAGPERIKPELDPEPLERAHSREDRLKGRFDTLRPRAIGATRGGRDRKGWSVCFDYVRGGRDPAAVCRVVTLNRDGSVIRIEHQDAYRESMAGFE